MTKITKSNVDAAMRDDAAHIDYLKRDVLDDQKYGGKYKDEDQTADEKHISKLAGDIKHDVHDKSFLSKHWSHNRAFSHESPLHMHGGVGPAGTAMDHMWGGESVEMKEQGGSPLSYDPLLSTESSDGQLPNQYTNTKTQMQEFLKPGEEPGPHHKKVPTTAPSKK